MPPVAGGRGSPSTPARRATQPGAGMNWFDSLARWSVGGGPAGPPGAPHRCPGLGRCHHPPDCAADGGGCRRRCPRWALALDRNPCSPALKKASALEKCVTKKYKAALADLKACTKRPRERYEDLSEGVAKRENALRKVKDPALRARIQQAIDRRTPSAPGSRRTSTSATPSSSKNGRLARKNVGRPTRRRREAAAPPGPVSRVAKTASNSVAKTTAAISPTRTARAVTASWSAAGSTLTAALAKAELGRGSDNAELSGALRTSRAGERRGRRSNAA